MTDFSILQTPNFAQAALGGYQAGRQIGQQNRMDTALKLYASDPEAGTQAVSALDPERGYKLSEMAREKQIRELTAKVYTQAPPSTDGQAAGFQLNQSALNDLAKVDPESAYKAQAFFRTANAAQIKQVTDHLQQKANAADTLLSVPPGPERGALFAQMRPKLMAQGYTPQELDSVDLSDKMLVRDKLIGLSFEQRKAEQKVDYKVVPPGGYLQGFRSDGTPLGDIQTTPPADTAPQPTSQAGRYAGPDPMAFRGGVETSGRRTPKGNAAVGGVDDSGHKEGGALDYVPKAGETLQQLQQRARDYFGDTARIGIHNGTHVHVELPGFHDVPYFGARGSAGAPSGMTAAQLISSANAAIAKGADPDKVHARLRELGAE